LVSNGLAGHDFGLWADLDPEECGKVSLPKFIAHCEAVHGSKEAIKPSTGSAWLQNLIYRIRGDQHGHENAVPEDLITEKERVFYLLKGDEVEYVTRQDLLAAAMGEFTLKKGAAVSEGHDFGIFDRIDTSQSGRVSFVTWKSYWETIHLEKESRKPDSATPWLWSMMKR